MPSTEAAGDLDAPADCETRQQHPNGSLGSATDVQADCDGAGNVVSLHRPMSVACTTAPTDLEPCVNPGGECQNDVDCESVVGGGSCASLDGQGGACACVLRCAIDADCPEDRACLCRSAVVIHGEAQTLVPHTACWRTDCRVDEGCGDGACALVNPMSTCVLAPDVGCRGPADACQSDVDCVDSPIGPSCQRTDGAWACGQSVCG